MSPFDTRELNQRLSGEGGWSARQSMFAAARRLVAAITSGLNVIGSLLIVTVTALIGADVVGRELLDSPISGVAEIVSLSILVIVFLQAPQALGQGRLARSDTLINLLTRRAPLVARIVETVFDALGAVVFAVILYGTLPLLRSAWVREEFIGAVGDFTAPVWPVKAAIALGSAALVVTFALRAIRRWRPGDDSV